MQPKEYKPILEGAIELKNCLVIFGNCEVWYSGRAESHLTPGDRIILIKEDKTILIHQPKGNNPINYMKSGTVFSFDIEEDSLMINAKNEKEFLNIKLYHIHNLSSQKLEDNEEISLAGTEKDMSEMIYNNPDLIGNNLKPVSMEEQTKYGFIDVLLQDTKNNNLVIVECKRYTGDLSAVTQLRRYVERLKESKGITNISGILACPKITPNALTMLNDWGFEHVEITPPKYLEKHIKNQKSLGEF